MLKLDKSQETNTLAIHLNTTESLDTLYLVYSQSYDLSNGIIEFNVDETKGKYRIGTISGSQIPSPSGQYNIDIYTGTKTPIIWGTATDTWSNLNQEWDSAYTLQSFIPAVWNQVDTDWGSYDMIWSKAGESGMATLLRTIRAWVSGSNDTTFTNYVSSNELGTYTTFNG